MSNRTNVLFGHSYSGTLINLIIQLIAVTDLGPTQLKNIAEPTRVYSLQVGVPAQAKPAKPTEVALPRKRLALVPLAAGIAALVILIAGSAWYFFSANRAASDASNGPPPLAAQRLSIVVLPFRQSQRRSGAGLPRRRTHR
jgi:adenylate cyclase